MVCSTDVSDYLDLDTTNKKAFQILRVSSIFDPGNNTLTYIYKNDKTLLSYIDLFGDETLFIINDSLKEYTAGHKSKMMIFSSQAKLDFVHTVKHFFSIPGNDELIAESAILDKDARIHPSVHIGERCIVGDCQIGENSRIESSAIIGDRTVIGQNVKIHQLCIIGSEDFGPIRRNDNSVEMFPQIGNVIIEDNVEIYAATIVGRGTLSSTIIRTGCKIDAMCQIGHNSDIGKNVVITANSVICGSVCLGENTYVGAHSVVRNECKIGKNVVIGMGSVVTKSFPDNVTVYGNPARIVATNEKPYNF